MFRHLLSILLLLLSQTLFGGKLPEIEATDVQTILEEIMEAHASHKELSPFLVKRALNQYLDELDPTKTYFLASEVDSWVSPEEGALSAIIEKLKEGDYTVFFEIQEKMGEAIARRNRLEEELEQATLPTNVSVSEFKELDWVETERELASRLLRIRALQTAAAEKLDEESKGRIFQRIEKKRANKEEELLTAEKKERERLIHSLVLKAFAASFDTHTAYFTPGEANQFMIQVQQRLFGIGALLRDDLNGFTVVKIIENGPATCGLKRNDRIIAIDDEPVVGMELMDAVELIRGEEGTPVKVTVLRETSEGVGEEKQEVEIIRGEVIIKEARIGSTVIPFGDGVIARIALHAFYQDPQNSSASDIYSEISKIRKEHKLKGIVLDLRNNAGGVLPQAVAVTGLFITKGIVVSIKDNNGKVEHLRDVDGKTAWDGPLIILTNKASASAAEIVAQTLQDYGRALVVGDAHTFGKGTFQTFTLDAGNNGKVNAKGEVKVTRGRYYTVSGKSPQMTGVIPDIVVPGLFASMELGERFAKYALENDSIPENFHDDLSDIPVMQRDQISWLYRFNLQSKLSTYTRHLPILKKNSAMRIEEDKFYQSFLVDSEQDEMDTATFLLYTQGDPQLKEALHILQDLIVLLN